MKYIITRLYYGNEKKCVFRFISRNNNVYDSIRSLIGTLRNTGKDRAVYSVILYVKYFDDIFVRSC